MPSFSNELLEHFNAAYGAYSEVTKREATGDKSVTIDKHEKEALSKCYPLTSFTRAGGALPDEKPTHFMFNHVLDGFKDLTANSHKLAIKYPKANKNELRLYFNRESEFYPDASDIWFIYYKEGEGIPYIGFMSEAEWKSIGLKQNTREIFEHDYTFDDEDECYQKSIAEPEAPKASQITSVTRHRRDPSLAKSALLKAKFTCEFNTTHTTFISGTTQKNFVEAHHLVPVSLTGKGYFNVNLDVCENIISLCPNCHRAIHYGNAPTKIEILKKLYDSRKEQLSSKGITLGLEELSEIYGASESLNMEL